MGYVQHTSTWQPADRRSQGGATGRGSVDSRARFRYGGPCFSAASSLPLAPGLGRPGRLLTLLTEAVRQPWLIAALIELVLRTRTEEVLLSQSPAGRGLRLYFNERFLGVFPQNRLCRAVLLLPGCHSGYLRGRHRQALRTNLHRAADAGISCEWITEAPRALDACREILHCRRLEPKPEVEIDRIARAWSKLFGRPEITLGVAWDPTGAPLAIIAAVIDERVCLIHSAVASNHEARWALHDHLVRLLIARGVEYLLCEGGGPFGALGFPREIHHYQRLLGYELRHLVPVNTHPLIAPSRRRRLAVLVRYPAGSRGQ